MKLLKKLTAIIILLSMLITLNSPIISYAEGETGTDTTGGSTTGEQTEEIGTEYEIKEEETWDISKNGDGSVIAKWTLEDRTITISGNGEMKTWYFESKGDWHNTQYQNIVDKIEIKSGINEITNCAFYKCNRLKTISIPNTVTNISTNAFSDCSSLEKIIVEENNQKYISIEGVLYNKDKTKIIHYPVNNSINNYTIPNSITSIESYKFRGRGSLTTIEIPDSVTSIGSSAFSGCISLTNIEIPNSVTSIGEDAFSGCSSLTNITIPNSVKSIGKGVFSGCGSLVSAEIPNSITSIESYTFSGCGSLANITIPNSVKSIGEGAFLGCCSLTSIAIPNSITNIENTTFSKCGSLTSIEIPNSVTSIGEDAFSECSSLTNITIPNSVTSIGPRTFQSCSRLTNMIIPNSITSIGYEAFDGCSSLINIEIPSSITSIEPYTFRKCSSLTSVEIPNSVTNIGEYAFSGCTGLTSIDIPSGVTSIVRNAFEECKKLENINVEMNNSNYISVDGVLYNNNKTKMICYPAGKQNTNFEILNSVTSLERGIFEGCDTLIEITIPDSVTSIEDIKFRGIIKCNTNSKAQEYCENNKIYYILLDNSTSNLSTDYKIKEEETWDISKNGDRSIIAKWTLEDRTITISGNGETKNWIISSKEDWHNSIYATIVERFEIESGVKQLGDRVFSGCSNMEVVNLPESVTRIRSDAFYGCKSLKSIRIPSNLFLENISLVSCTSLTEITVSNNNRYYKSIEGVLYSKDQTEIIKYPAAKEGISYIIPNSVTKIESSAFYGCSNLANITIPNSVTSIEGSAFSECRSLTNIEIPNSVTRIGGGAFSKCRSLTNIEIPISITSIEPDTFKGCSNLTNIEIPDSVTSIGERAFGGCIRLNDITIPSKVTNIEEYAFSECRGLTNINIPNGVTSIGKYAFNYCSKLNNITIPSSVTSIKYETFSNCSSLINITIPSSVTSIESRVFFECSSLTNIGIPSSVTSIGREVFMNCSSLTDIEIPKNLTSLEYGVFNGCSKLSKITIPSKVTNIGEYAFEGCSSLTSINIPNSVTSIGQFAFSECINLKDIIIPDSVTSIGNYAFKRTYAPKGTIVCKRNTEAHRYAEGEKIGYILDERMPKVTNTPSEFEKAQKQVVVKIDVTDITGVEEDNIKYLWSTKEEVTKEEVNNALTNGQELSSPTGKTGTYYIYVYAKDKFGNEGIAKSSPIKLDNTAPTIELAENKYYQKPNIQDENLETVVLTKDGNKVETYKYGETIFGEGTYEITAIDEAGNSTTKEFVLQKIPTGEEELNYEITPSELTNQDVTLNVSKKDATNTELEIELSTDGKNYEVGNTKTITENGKVYARLGKEGAYGEAIEIEITNIDKKAPVIEGVKDKRTYANKATPKAVDENLESVKLEKEGQEVVGYENGTIITELGTYKITAIDKVGNKTEVEFYIKDIPSTEEVVDYTVSPEGLTNQDVKVSVTKKENEEYQDLIVQMSTDSENYEAVTEKTITENGTVYIRIVKEEEGNTIEGEVIEVEIKNIDKTAPKAQVAYSNKELTKENVTVTITANEEVQEVEGWTRGEDRKTLTKEYSENKTEEITVKDLAGNSTKVTIEITNIDKTAPEGQVTYSETNPTNKNVIATITANEEIQEVEGWTISQDKKKLTKEYNANKIEKVIIKDKIGNEREVDVKVLNIDRTAPLASVNYSTKNKTNKNVTVTITANEKIQGITGWTLSSDKKKLTKEYNSNKTETITIKDLAGNSSNVTIKITNIDKIIPTVNVKYSATNVTNQNVIVTIEANEEIQEITGWTLSNDKKTLTKTYQSNEEERIEIKDVAGNTVYKNISIKNIDKTSPVITGVEEGKVYKDSVTAIATDANPGTLVLEKDGIKVEGYTNGKEIIQEGTYKLTAVDKLGNTTIVNFTIKYSRGDININNNIDTGDVLALLRYIAQNTSKKVAERHPDWNFNEKNKIIGDVNKNGIIDTGDVLTLQRYQAAKSSKTIAEKHPEWLNIE